jgi:hypothetical protein
MAKETWTLKQVVSYLVSAAIAIWLIIYMLRLSGINL